VSEKLRHGQGVGSISGAEEGHPETKVVDEMLQFIINNVRVEPRRPRSDPKALSCKPSDAIFDCSIRSKRATSGVETP